MKQLKSILPLILLFSLVVPGSCTLDFYNADRTMKIKVNFPHPRNAVNSDKLLRPAGESPDYVPPFIDKIEVIISGEGTSQVICESIREGNAISNSVDCGEFAYASGLTFEVNAYSYNPNNPEGYEWVKTHSAPATVDISDSDVGSGNVELTLEVLSGTPLDIYEGSKKGGYFSGNESRSMGSDPYGNFLIAFLASAHEVDFTGPIYAVKIDPKGVTSSMITVTDTAHNASELSFPSIYLNGNFLIPFTIGIEPEVYPGLIRYGDSTEIEYVSDVGVTTTYGSQQTYVTSNRDYVFVAWKEADDSPYSDIYWKVYNHELKEVRGDFASIAQGNNPLIVPVSDTAFFIIFQGNDKKIYASRCTLSSNLCPITDKPITSDEKEAFAHYTVARTSDSNFLFAYSSSAPSATGLDMYVDKMSSSFATVPGFGANKLLDENESSSDQQNVTIANYRGNNAVIVWEDKNGSGSGLIYYALLDEDGNMKSDEVLVSEGTGIYVSPQISISDDGLALITWIEKTPQVNINYRRYVF